MFSKYRKELLQDCFEFLQLIGGANRLSEAGWDSEDIMDEEYMSDIEELRDKYLPDESTDYISEVEECLEVEELLYKFFDEELREIIMR